MYITPKILIVDDEPRICESLKYLLSRENYEIFTATSGSDALDLLSEYNFDVVILDIIMPDLSGHQIMDYINSNYPDISVIIITGDITLDSAIGALRRGAYDYLTKPLEYDRLLNTVHNAIEQKRLKYENKVINEKFGLSQERYKYLVQNSPDIIYTLDSSGNFTFVNSVVEKLLGYKSTQLIGKLYTTIIYKLDIDKAQWLFNERRTGARSASGIELRLNINYESDQFKDREKKYLTIELKATGMYTRSAGKTDKFLGTYGVSRNISNRKLLEDRLRRVERMKFLGTMAGGIAHDFNNLLMSIQGNVSLILMKTDSDAPYYKRLKNIEQAVQSGANLTKQLLGFGLGGRYEVKPTDLNELIDKCLEMFGRTHKEIAIYKKFQKDIWPVEVDRGQIEQVFLNMYVNAWQAMPGGGDICIETNNVILNKDNVKYDQLEPGRHVVISVNDNGIGMDEATIQRIFDPFFTTKAKGRGTGLGLASAYGIINNHNGLINVSSEKGKGTTFYIYLPVTDNEVIEDEMPFEDLLRGKETVLLVDDEDIIIDVGLNMLQLLGYKVLTARSGRDSIEIYKKNKDKVDIIILDMIMPDMDGQATYNRLKEIKPDVKVILASGHSINGQAAEMLKKGCNGFIPKPFTVKCLSEKMRDVLDEVIELS